MIVVYFPETCSTNFVKLEPKGSAMYKDYIWRKVCSFFFFFSF